MTILILQTFTFSNSGWPIAQKKTPDHWDQRAEKMAENCASPTDSYLQQLTSKIDLQGAQTLFDMGCGPGTVSLALADKLDDLWR